MSIFLIDGNSLAWAGSRNGGFGYCLEQLESAFDCSHAAVCFDLGVPKRKKIFSFYKKHRARTPEQITGIIQEFETWLSQNNFPWVMRHGYEADDLVGSFAYRAHERGMQVKLWSNDLDFLQLVRPDSCLITEEKVWEYDSICDEYGLEPYRLPELWSLTGDRYDGIKGVMGKEKALYLMKQYGSLGSILQLPELSMYNETVLRNLELIKLNGIEDIGTNFDELSMDRFKIKTGGGVNA